MSRAPGTRRRLWLSDVAFAIPGDLETSTGGYAYDRRMIAELRALGWQVEVVGLGDGFPLPSAAQMARPRRACSATRRTIVRSSIDGLAFGVLPELAADLQRTPSADRAGPSSAGAGDRACGRRGRTRCCAQRTRGARRRRGTSSRPARRRRTSSTERFGVAAERLDGGPARHRSRAVRRRQLAAARSRCSRSARSCRARATTCWSRRWRRSPICRGA